MDTTCFQAFLELFSQTYPQDFHILQLDNGSFHQANDLTVPDNIILLFQPSHCPATFWGESSPQKLAPELNPIERLWEYIKSFLGWQLFNNLDELRDKVRRILNSLTPEIVISLTGWNYILQALSVAAI